MHSHLQRSKIRTIYPDKYKYTNLIPYHPYYSEVESWSKKYQLWEKRSETLFKFIQPISVLYHPLSIEDVKKVLARIPHEYTQGIHAIILCKGSKKQRNIWRDLFGCYDSYTKSIFLFPYYKHNFFNYRNRPRPHICHQFERHGAVWNSQKGTFHFSKEAMRSYYMWDVLAHEIGHHVSLSIQNRRLDYQSEERFAEWFAMEFGMRNRSKI